MCEQNVPAISITLANEPESEFRALTNLMKESGPGGDEENGGEEEDADELE